MKCLFHGEILPQWRQIIMQLLFGIVMTAKQESIHDQILDLHQGWVVNSGYDQIKYVKGEG